MLTGVRLCRRAASFANARTQWTNTYWNPGRGGCCTGVTRDRAADLGLNSKDHAEIAAPQSQLRAEMATARVKDHLYILQRRPAVKSYTTVARRGCGQQSHETYATTVRSHPQLLNGRLRSTTASCGSTAQSKTARAEVLVAVIRTHHRMHLASIAFCSEALLRDMALLHYRSQDILACTFSQAPGWALVGLGGGHLLDGGSPPGRHGHRALPTREALDYE